MDDLNITFRCGNVNRKGTSLIWKRERRREGGKREKESGGVRERERVSEIS